MNGTKRPRGHKLGVAPLLSIVLAAAWLLLNGTVTTGHLLLACVLAVWLPRLTDRLREDQPRIGAAGTMARLAGVVVWDIIVSNLQVARLVLGRLDRIESRFIRMRVELDEPRAVALLAGIVTMTPGTLSVDVSPDRRELIIHALHAPDPDAIVGAIRTRYEHPLREIFRC